MSLEEAFSGDDGVSIFALMGAESMRTQQQQARRDEERAYAEFIARLAKSGH